jgi:hypothetical protein
LKKHAADGANQNLATGVIANLKALLKVTFSKAQGKHSKGSVARPALATSLVLATVLGNVTVMATSAQALSVDASQAACKRNTDFRRIKYRVWFGG